MFNYVISDIHGNAERFSRLLSFLKKKHTDGNFKLYVIGDLFDRGYDSERVLSLICDNSSNVEVLKGNHEELFMKFMEHPTINYPNWQINGSYSKIVIFQ